MNSRNCSTGLWIYKDSKQTGELWTRFIITRVANTSWNFPAFSHLSPFMLSTSWFYSEEARDAKTMTRSLSITCVFDVLISVNSSSMVRHVGPDFYTDFYTLYFEWRPGLITKFRTAQHDKLCIYLYPALTYDYFSASFTLKFTMRTLRGQRWQDGEGIEQSE